MQFLEKNLDHYQNLISCSCIIPDIPNSCSSFGVKLTNTTENIISFKEVIIYYFTQTLFVWSSTTKVTIYWTVKYIYKQAFHSLKGYIILN